MLQIDHVYEFLYQELFKDFELWYIPNGVPKLGSITIHDISIFTRQKIADKKIFSFDQEPVLPDLLISYFEFFTHFDFPAAFATSERSNTVTDICNQHNFYSLYYFFHGFAALDWFRGFYSMNYNKPIIKNYKHDFISFNRIINEDRSYRIYFLSKLAEYDLLKNNQISFNVTDDTETSWQDEVSDSNSKLSNHAKLHIETHLTDIHKLVIDRSHIHGSASADIPRNIDSLMPPELKPPEIDSLWHIVTETVFYYDKLHLTEKIFKPIVSKQPFMLLAAPGNLEYLRSYGFKTFDGIIDESYDRIQDPDARIDAVVAQLAWYCALSAEEKRSVIEAIAPIVEYNFHHFYGEFKHIITRELLDNCKTLFKEIGYDDKNIAYDDIYKVLTT